MGIREKILALSGKKTTKDPESNDRINPNFEQLNSNYNLFSNGIIKEKCSVSELVRRKKGQDFFAIDLETTGLSSENDRIVEIGIVKFSGDTVINTFNTLINPGRPMPKQATAVNHITDSMLKDAPLEEKALQDMLEFLNQKPMNDIVFCAHNADFDINFLTNALKRHGFSLSFSYVDTYRESRKIIPGLINYKLATVAENFNIINDKAHRAKEDAKVCGIILRHLVQQILAEQEAKKEQNKIAREKTMPREGEQMVCAFIFSMLNEAGKNLSLLRFYRNSSNYIDVEYFYTMFKFKFAKKGKYVILPSDVATTSGLPTENTTITEGGAEYLRAFFNAPSDLLRIKDFVIKSYDRCYREFLTYSEYSQELSYYENDLDTYCSFGMQLSSETADLLVNAAKDINSIFDQKIELEQSIDVDFSELEINPVHSRVSLSKIRNANDWDTGFDDGYSFWEEGDTYRKSGSFAKAIDCFDKARFNGYCAPVLYESYAMTFHKAKDYDNEIDILNEGIERIAKLNMNISLLLTRRNNAIKALMKQREREKEAKEKRGLEKSTCIKVEKATKNKVGRSIFQMDDDGNIVEKFESIADAVRKTGVNSKSIRDTAKGVQKHAGGYIWKFPDENNID